MSKIAVVFCPYCGNLASLIDSSEIYQRSYGYIWMCRPCDAYTGVHQSSPRYAPLGTLAKKELRELRKQVHAKFDPLWKKGKMTRKQAYFWLAKEMGIPEERCHVAQFSEEKCKKALVILSNF